MDLFLAHLLATVAVGLFPLGVGYWVYARGRGRAALAFAALLGVIAFVAEGLALQMVVGDPVTKAAIFHLREAASLAIGPLWLLFALYFTGRDRYVTRRLVGPLAAVAGALVLGVFTNPLHGLTYPAIETASAPFSHLVYATGPLYWAGWVFSYALIAAGLALLFHLFVRSRHVSRKQPAVVMLAAAISVAFNLSDELSLLPVTDFPYSVFGMCLFSAVTGVAVYSHRLFDLTPLARDRVVEAIDNPVLVVDGHGRVVDYNVAARTLFPGAAAAVGPGIGTVAPDLLAPEESPDRFADSLTVFRDGERRTFSVSVTPIGVGADRQAHALVLKDVTELEAYARRLEQQTDQLERVASTISHDLRNPLSVAEGAIELARDGDEAELDRASEALERIEQIVDETLELAREGQAVGDRTLVPLDDVVRDAWATSDTSGAALVNEISEDRLVYADEGRLRTLLENLYRNSVEHGSTSPDVTVRVGLLRDGGDAVGFYVEDDGPGIPESERGDVLDTGYTTDPGGTGLGLAIVESITTAHGWSVTVTAGADGGARFEFRGADIVASEAVEPESVPAAE